MVGARGRWISYEHTTIAEGNSTRVGDTALSMARLFAAVSVPCDTRQSGKANTEQRSALGV